MSAPIKIENVTKRYGARTVLDDISLHIQPGEFVVFLRPVGLRHVHAFAHDQGA